jgi:CubicO group peptidase (beta-lactamase class C family)
MIRLQDSLDPTHSFAALAVVLAVVGPASVPLIAAEPPNRELVGADIRFAQARRDLVERVAGGELPSIAVAVAAGGRVLWEEAIGWADREAERAATPQSLYGLGSLGKSLLATTILVLVESGEVDLDDPVTEHLGDAELRIHPHGARPPTVRELLQMTGGIPHGHIVYFGGDHQAPGAREIVERYAAAALPPGEHYEYSNFSYGLLEQVVRGVTGKSYAEYARSAVFDPLAMRHTSVGLPIDAAGGDPAVRYGRSGSPIDTMIAAPASSLDTHSTLDDLLRYGLFHLGLRRPEQWPILGSETLERMHSDRSGLPGALMALGWAVIELEADTVLVTNGLVSGASATLLLFPEKQALVIALANISSDGVTDDVAFGLAEILIPGLLAEFQAARAEYESGQARPWKPTADLLGSWKGEISTPDGELSLSVRFQEDGDVHVRLGEQPRTLLDGARWTGDRLSGALLGALPWSETGDDYLELQLTLVPGGDRLLGWVTASVYDGERFFQLPAPLGLVRESPPNGGSERRE